LLLASSLTEEQLLAGVPGPRESKKSNGEGAALLGRIVELLKEN
jgi:hypothetical protein